MRTDMGTGSITALIISGPIILLGLNTLGLIILLFELDLQGSRILLVLFWRDRYSFARSFLLWPRGWWSCDTSALDSLLSHRPEWSSQSFSIIFLWQIVQGLVRAPQDSICLAISAWPQLFSQYLHKTGFLGQTS